MKWFDCKKPIIALAPLADYTDSPFCRICREVAGNKFVIFREMVSSEAVVRGNEKTLKMCQFNEIERPIILQIFGSEPCVMAKATKILVEKFKPDGIDINMGCPVPKVTGKVNAGASLMKDRDRAVVIVKAVKAMNLGVLISVKTRLGWSKEDDILEFAPKLEQAGADFITVHGRTKMQGYAGKATWEMIGRVKKLLSIPVLANGDIGSQEDIEKCLKITKADGVMIGRGALGNPWLFGSILSSSRGRGMTMNDRINIILKHAKYHLERYGEDSMRTFRKHLLWYFKGDRIKEVSNIKELRKKLVKVQSIEELLVLFKLFI